MKQLLSLPETPSTDRLLCVKYFGVRVPYDEGMAQMKRAVSSVLQGGMAELHLLQHLDTITTTRLHGDRSFRVSRQEIERRAISVVETDRGGDVTFHGEGQLVGYLVMKLDPVDLVGYLRTLEYALLRSMKAIGLENAQTLEGKTGIWISQKNDQSVRKLIAIGVGVSKGVTRHGFALNVTTNLERFTECIIPCGLEGFGVTSLERELALEVSYETLMRVIQDEIAQAFRFEMQPPPWPVGEERVSSVLQRGAPLELRAITNGKVRLRENS